ncbi:MAG: acyltransferase [Catenisphaera adipataccumulans]|jgi:surface polysaccharide O-acyltransferase-like enzyme|uniref:acyltransferase n=1 Tax=Catenisphaera adipataccumulans TaxID=700500 RepID=UPI003D8C3BB7
MDRYSTNNQTREVVSYFSYLRIVACICIIILHIVYSAVLVYGNSISAEQYTHSMMICNNLMWAVPCFVMITGALLLDPNREVSLKKLFGKYISRMIWALAIAIVVFNFVDLWMNHDSFSVSMIGSMVYQFFTNTSWSHLWYLYLLIGLYLILPAMKKITQNANEKEIKYLLLIGFLFLSVFQLFNIWNVPFAFYIHISTIYPFYFLLGYAIQNRIIDLNRIKSLCLILVSTVLLLIATYQFYMNGVQNIDILWSYNSVFVVIQSAGVFGFFQSIKKKETKTAHVLNAYTFGVYIFHMIIVRYLYKVMLINPFTNTLWNFLWMISITTLISFAFMFIIKKIPGLKKVY